MADQSRANVTPINQGWEAGYLDWEPEKFGLELLGEFDHSEPSYSFDKTAVWTDGRKVYCAWDSGCSCPTPFEDVRSYADLTDLGVPGDHPVWASLRSHLVRQQGETYDSPRGSLGEIVRFVRKLERDWAQRPAGNVSTEEADRD